MLYPVLYLSNARSIVNKLTNLEVTLYQDDVDLCIIGESWIDEISCAFAHVEGFTKLSVERKHKKEFDENSFEYFNKLINECFSKCILCKTYKMTNRDPQWITTLIKDIEFRRQKAFKQNDTTNYSRLSVKLNNKIAEARMAWANNKLGSRTDSCFWKVCEDLRSEVDAGDGDNPEICHVRNLLLIMWLRNNSENEAIPFNNRRQDAAEPVTGSGGSDNNNNTDVNRSNNASTTTRRKATR
ncbi:hypothetical protein GJ496_006383 [Pomphorhynchus laevis]|nr:hypothetical protein GJ496_006383 [Pomphorhynchus laevis]